MFHQWTRKSLCLNSIDERMLPFWFSGELQLIRGSLYWTMYSSHQQSRSIRNFCSAMYLPTPLNEPRCQSVRGLDAPLENNHVNMQKTWLSREMCISWKKFQTRHDTYSPSTTHDSQCLCFISCEIFGSLFYFCFQSWPCLKILNAHHLISFKVYFYVWWLKKQGRALQSSKRSNAPHSTQQSTTCKIILFHQVKNIFSSVWVD